MKEEGLSTGRRWTILLEHKSMPSRRMKWGPRGKGVLGLQVRQCCFLKFLLIRWNLSRDIKEVRKQVIRFSGGGGLYIPARHSESQITQSLEVETYLASLRDSKEASVVGAQCARGAARKWGQRGGGGADYFQPFRHCESFGIYSGEMEQTLNRSSHFRQSKRALNKYLLNK